MAIAAGLNVLAPMAAAAQEIFSHRPAPPKFKNMLGLSTGTSRVHRTSHRTAAMDKRDAKKRRNVLRNRSAHR